MKFKTLKKWVGRIITTAMVTALIMMAFVVFASKASGGEPEIFGYQLKTVLSGSMEPNIQTGSIIAVKPGGDMTRFQENDVITYIEEDGKLVTHRVVDVMNNGEHVMYQTKGDNNDAPDSAPVLSENVVAEYTGFTIPYLGYLVNFSQSQNGAFLLLVPGLLLLSYSGFIIWKALKELESVEKGKQNQNGKNESLSS